MQSQVARLIEWRKLETRDGGKMECGKEYIHV